MCSKQGKLKNKPNTSLKITMAYADLFPSCSSRYQFSLTYLRPMIVPSSKLLFLSSILRISFLTHFPKVPFLLKSFVKSLQASYSPTFLHNLFLPSLLIFYSLNETKQAITLLPIYLLLGLSPRPI